MYFMNIARGSLKTISSKERRENWKWPRESRLS